MKALRNQTFLRARWILLCLALAGICRLDAEGANGVFNVRDFGAKGDGITLDSGAINAAIAACSAAGGGKVMVPPGKFYSGTLQLRSQVTLFLDAGARLIGSTNLQDYSSFVPPEGTPESKFRAGWHRALLVGDGLTDVTVTGHGIIDGNKVFDAKGEERMRGPHTVILGNCTNLVFRDISFVDSANYAIMLEKCEKVDFRNLKITGGWDGIHFRGWPGRPCRNVNIIGCQLYTGDDAIAGRYWEDVVISGCILNSSCNGIRLIGPAVRLTIQDCLFYGPGLHPHRTSNRYNMLAAVCLQPGAWDETQGLLDEVLVSDLTIHNVTTPFLFTLKPGNTAGKIVVERVNATRAYRAAASVESWAQTPFTNVVFRDVNVEFTGGGKEDQAQARIQSPGVDARPLPCWALYGRNVENLTLEDVRFSYENLDLRPAIQGQDIQTLTLDHVRFPKPSQAPALLSMANVGKIITAEMPDSVLKPTYRSIDAMPDPAVKRLIAGKGWTAVAVVGTDSQRGLYRVDVSGGGLNQIVWTWLEPESTKTVSIPAKAPTSAGTQTLQAGGLSKSITFESE